MDKLVTFEAWADSRADLHDVEPDGAYSRLAWLPTLGPSGWLIWGTLAAQLRREREVAWDLSALARAHGLGGGTGERAVVVRTLSRLDQFGLVVPRAADRYLARVSAPPVARRHLRRLPQHVTDLHRQTFGPVASSPVAA